jgi:hypothetical protein
MSESRRGCLAVCLGADHKLCRLGRGRGSKMPISPVKRHQSGGRGSETVGFETTVYGRPLGVLTRQQEVEKREEG